MASIDPQERVYFVFFVWVSNADVKVNVSRPNPAQPKNNDSASGENNRRKTRCGGEQKMNRQESAIRR
jgi:hypothetical protein